MRASRRATGFVAAFAAAVLFTTVARAADWPPKDATAGLGLNIHGVDDRDFDPIQASGCRIVRVDLQWNMIETAKGVYDFSHFDRIVDALTARGIHVLGVLAYGNDFYGVDLTADTWRQGFANYVAATVAHYRGRGNLYEIWNEPNAGINGYVQTMDAKNYMAILRRTAPAVRQADPDAVVLAPGSSGIDFPYLTACCEQGLLSLVDGVSVHPYRMPENGPETATADYAKLRSIIAEHTPTDRTTLPIICSEWGYTPTDTGITPELQGDYLARMFLVNLSQGVPVSIWYKWKNDGVDPANREMNFGTVYPDLSPKPAYRALERLTQALAGSRFVERLPTPDERDWLLVFATSDGRKTLAAWTTREPHAVALPDFGSIDLGATPHYGEGVR